MRPTDIQEDPILAALRELRTYDVSAARLRRLRRRCHRRFAMQRRSGPTPWRNAADAWRRVVAVCAAAWCVLYVFETLRRAAAAYRP